MIIGEKDPFYPFPVIYAEINDNRWLAYDDNWTDGFVHRVFLIDGIFYEKKGSSYNESYDAAPLVPCDSSVRQAFATIPYVAEYKEENGELFCPNGHIAGYYYPFPGCLDHRCPFYRCRQYHYSESSQYPWSRGKKVMEITINGQKFQNPWEKKHASE